MRKKLRAAAIFVSYYCAVGAIASAQEIAQPDLSKVAQEITESTKDGLQALRERNARRPEKGSNRFFIFEVRENRYNELPADDPESLYMVSLRQEKDNWYAQQGMLRKQLQPLLDFYGVKKPEELSGGSFISPREDHFSALRYFLLELKHNGKYTPPSPEKLKELIALSLSKMEQPNFPDVDDQTIATVFENALDPAWIEELAQQVLELSDGAVLLMKADVTAFPHQHRGQAQYLVLKKGYQKQLVILTPSFLHFVER